MGNHHASNKHLPPSDPANVTITEISFRIDSHKSANSHRSDIGPLAPPALSLNLHNIPSIPEAALSLSNITSPHCHSVRSQPLTKTMRRDHYSKSCSNIPRSNSVRSKLGHRRKSSLLHISNGITGKFISSRICKIVAKFWHENIDSLSTADQLEIGCSIFFGMLSSNNDMKKLMKRNFRNPNTIESTSLKYLNMMGWLARYLVTDNVDLYSLLTKLGAIHQKMGIDIQHFTPMLAATHESFGYYFESKYSIEIKYALDEIFSLAAQLMTGQSLKNSAHLLDISQQFKAQNIPFLKNLDICLQSSIGKEYLYRYFAQTWCDELSIFLQSLQRFKQGLSDKARFMIARDIMKASVNPEATFALNISYDLRKDTLYRMSKLNVLFLAKKKFQIDVDFFDELETEIYRLIQDNHWKKFVESIETLHSKSFSV